jgi:hypothetical protein
MMLAFLVGVKRRFRYVAACGSEPPRNNTKEIDYSLLSTEGAAQKAMDAI